MADEWTVIDAYTSDDAENDGILVPVKDIKPEWDAGPIKYITRNLLDSKGYIAQDGSERTDITRDRVIVPNVQDLLVQVQEALRKGLLEDPDVFYKATVEFPTGEKGQIFIAPNEHMRYTVMLPEDY